MQKLRDAIIKETVIEGRAVYLCISGDKIELFYSRESAEKRARQMTVIFA